MAAVAEHGVIKQEGERDERPVDTRIRPGVPILLLKDQGKVVTVELPHARVFDDDGSTVRQERAVEKI